MRWPRPRPHVCHVHVRSMIIRVRHMRTARCAFASSAAPRDGSVGPGSAAPYIAPLWALELLCPCRLVAGGWAWRGDPARRRFCRRKLWRRKASSGRSVRWRSCRRARSVRHWWELHLQITRIGNPGGNAHLPAASAPAPPRPGPADIWRRLTGNAGICTATLRGSVHTRSEGVLGSWCARIVVG